MNHQFRENYTPTLTKSNKRMSLILSAVYIAAAVVVALDLFVWRAA